jgi:cell division septum initiation protein DivIVA
VSPEEIRHLAIGRSVHGYDRKEVDRLLAEIADSFEAVWHQRTTLYADVQQLQEQLKRQEIAHGDRQRADAERNERDRAALLAELEHAQTELQELRAAGEQLDAEQDERHEEQERSAAELTRLQADAERLRNERDRLLEETRRWTTVISEERTKLSEFLLNALDQVEQVSTNGTTPAARQNELNELQPASGFVSRAGTPATVAPLSTSPRTTAPAPTIAPSPIVTPPRMTAPDPSEAPRLTRVSSSSQSTAR